MIQLTKTLSSLALIGLLQLSAQAQENWQMQPVNIQTRWAKEVNPGNALKEYPRPQMVRSQWQNLNGLWQYAITPRDAAAPASYNGQILVPYPIESALSGVKKTVLPHQNLWYKRNIARPALKKGERALLHLGAVDWQASVFLNGKPVGDHTGGYQEFTCDITDALQAGNNELTVKVYDPTDQGPNPHGKQVLSPKDIYYTPSTGIWQTVWMEVVPAAAVADIRLTPDIDKSVLNVTVKAPEDCEIVLTATAGGKTVSTAKGIPGANIQLPVKNAKLWSPADPFLYDLQVQLIKNSKIIDEVKSYFGMRKVAIKKDANGFDRIFLNNHYTYNLGTLDQGFWPEGLHTAPTDEALAFDIKAIKAMGFNTIRKHIKVEPARWYYHCDKLGMLVWQDFVNPPHHMPEGAREEFEKEVAATMEQLHNHPCITTWVLFNEKWGAYDQQRLTEWVKQKDPSRLINGHSGEMLWVNEQLRSPSPNAWVSADMTDVHSYPDPMNAPAHPGKARILGEFGGIGVFIPDHQWNPMNAWGYIQVTPSSLKGKYTIMNQHLQLLEREGLSGSIYTQPFDVEGEQNGLMTYDREVIKVPFEELRKIHSRLVADMGAIPAVTAKAADITDPGIQYSRLLQQYIDGKKDPAFLRKLAMTAQQAGDKPGARRAAAGYIAGLKKPYSADDLSYIMQVTGSTQDPGFAILQEHTDEIDLALGQRQASVKMMNLIYQDHIHPAVSRPNAQPDWEQLAGNTSKYGAPGEEILLRAKTIYYLNRQEWDSFAKAAAGYVSKYGQYMRTDELNQFAWTAFEQVNDTSLLEPALDWSQLSLKGGDQAAYLDTYANLLYKLGKKEEAIKYQEKAVSLTADASLKENLEKMKRGERTWK
ncbi:sugar-binding domain-containing protein [Chitinophaga japonensis]|uniref:Glycosyl hydrolase family 2 n=1 Tax=Chitinophaga japonensis TaxID=104662 RepID=A0A562STF1_CHIJA|nr:sugar-binding domain-containing protein [Chitinophaga japonensis]TWI84378.1 glycosyl hydrolase family 2 [Chitinophaga japonensis]